MKSALGPDLKLRAYQGGQVGRVEAIDGTTLGGSCRNLSQVCCQAAQDGHHHGSVTQRHSWCGTVIEWRSVEALRSCICVHACMCARVRVIVGSGGGGGSLGKCFTPCAKYI